MFGGRFAPSRSHLEEVVALYDPTSHGLLTHQTLTYPQVTAQAYLWIVLLCLGYSDQAMALSDAAIAEARAMMPNVGPGVRIHFAPAANLVRT